jgi:hypothetical protein
MGKKLFIASVIILVLLAIISIYIIRTRENTTLMEINSTKLIVSGDLDNEYKIGDLNRLYNSDVQFNGDTIKTVDLKTVFDSIGLKLREDYKIQITGNEKVIETKLVNIENYYLTENEENFTLFDSSGNLLIENIEKIFLVNLSKNWKTGLNIIDPETNIVNLMPSDFSINNYEISSFKSNSIAISNEDSVFQEVHYNKKKIINLNDYLDFPQIRTTVIDKTGNRVNFEDGLIEIDGNTFNLIDQNGVLILEDLKGIIVNTPVYNINDVYLDSMHYLKKNEQVLIIIINGLGYYQYVNAFNNGDIPFLQTQTIANRSLTVYEPTTENALKEMFNYEGENLFNQMRSINNESIYISNFKYIENENLEYIKVEDANNDYFYDDDTFLKIEEIISNNNSLIVSNFTDYEKNALAFGPNSDEALKTLKNLDNYISQISDIWPGNIIITSDSGIHETEEGEGNGGQFRYEDLFVPYIIIEK